MIQEHLIHADWLDVDQSPTACASCPPRLLLILYNAANLTMIECLSRQLYCTVAQNAYVTNLLLDCACIYTESRVICQRAPICRSVLFLFFSLRPAFSDIQRGVRGYPADSLSLGGYTNGESCIRMIVSNTERRKGSVINNMLIYGIFASS